MKLDRDLEAIRHKLDAMDASHSTTFTDEEHSVLANALAHSQRARSTTAGNGATASRDADETHQYRSELDFFILCIGYTLVAFAILATLRWSSETPLGATGIFGLAFLAGLSGTALRAYYIGRWAPSRAPLAIMAAAILCLVGSFFGLIASGGIGAAAGIVLGAIFFRTLIKKRPAESAATTDTAR
ncbi:hypothetical protein [Salinisphaera aquimarina]|uniref:Uncharacterized protein n=1 Tax=Salinisphaera aquimarina TaxID=2094031 RepID=A0ABV7ENS9_9GAMM